MEEDTADTPVSTDHLGRKMYTVKCSECGSDAEVPFEPSGDRPVYCRDCYRKRRSNRRRY